MTRDIPVFEVRTVCRPTGRPERREPELRRAERVGARPEARRRSIEDRRWLGALLVGGMLAAMVWLVIIVGEGVESAAAPEVPASTSVVYVRSGESLTALAERIAPELPTAGVIAQVRELNGLETSGLYVGQALVVPDYR